MLVAGLGGLAVLADWGLEDDHKPRKMTYGCYYPGKAGDYTFGEVERQLDYTFGWYSTFISLDSRPSGHSEITTAAAKGHNVMVAFRPTRTAGVTFADILAGRYDDVLSEWFAFLRGLPCQVVIRWAWEMNGNFMPYSPVYAGGDGASSHCLSPAQYIAVWRYVVALQRRVATKNVRWFFCANATDTGGIPLESFFPGVDNVQIVGYDSYNTLNAHFMTASQTLAGYANAKQGNAYDRVCKLHPTAEVWIGETGCIDINDPKEKTVTIGPLAKADFYRDLFAFQGLPRLKTVVFFDAEGTRDWRFDTSASSLAAIRKGLSAI